MRRHMKHKHRGSQQVKCIICNNWLKSKKALREHMEEEHGSITLPSSCPTEKTCPVCGIVLNNKKSLWLGHLYYQHMVPAAFYTCPLQDCSKTVSKLEDDHCLKLHLASHHDLQVDTIHHCHLCPQKCLSHDDLVGHLEVDHLGLNHTTCPLCDLPFPRHQLLALHLFQHHGRVLRTPGDKATDLAHPPIQPEDLEAPTTTKYTFVEPLTLKSGVGEVFGDPVEAGSEVKEIFFKIDEGVIVEEIPQLANIDLPEGATILKATENEILLEVEDTSATVNPEEELGGEVNLNVPTVGENQNVLIYLGESVVEVDVGDTGPSDGRRTSPVRRRKSGAHSKARHPCTWPGCDKTFVAKHSVSIHVRNVHMSESVECEKCGKSYSNEENLKVHVRTIHGAVSTPCNWPGCSRVLSSERQMKSHYLKHSEEPRSCPEPGCSSTLKNSAVLRMHLRKMHGKRQGQEQDVSNAAPPTITTYKIK